MTEAVFVTDRRTVTSGEAEKSVSSPSGVRDRDPGEKAFCVI